MFGGCLFEHRAKGNRLIQIGQLEAESRARLAQFVEYAKHFFNIRIYRHYRIL